MPLASPEPGCHLVTLPEALALEEPAEMALEDYARVLTHARAAEAVREGQPPRVTGVHVCGAERPPSAAAVADLIAFARDLASRTEGGGGLGWT